MWLILSILAAVFWGVGQIFIKKGLATVSPVLNNVLDAIFGVLFFIPFCLYHGVNMQSVLLLLPYTILIATGYFAYYYILEKGTVSLMSTLMATYPITTIILAHIILHEQTNFFQTIALFLIILASLILALPENIKSIKSIRFESWLLWGLLGSFLLGAGDFGAKLSIVKTDLYSYLFALSIAYVVVSILNVIIDKKGRKLPPLEFKKVGPTLLGVGLLQLGWIPFYGALSNGLASLVSPVSASYVIITLVLAFFFLKEKLNRLQYVAILIMLMGIIMVSVV